MDSAEFAEWQAYFEVEPWGIPGMEILMAQLCQIVWATSGAKNPPAIEELMVLDKARRALGGPKVKSGEQLLAEARAALSSGNYKVVR